MRISSRTLPWSWPWWWRASDRRARARASRPEPIADARAQEPSATALQHPALPWWFDSQLW